MTDTTGAIGIGYEGKPLENLIRELQASNVRTVVDVRLNAISRKPGFSKRALAAALEASGIAYLHRPELGNPRDNRSGFASDWHTDDGRAARSTYSDAITSDTAAAVIDELAGMASQQRIALLCFEASELHCHRREALSAIRERLSQLTAA